MITENERTALQLAMRVFEHFTRDALPIAREIIELEQRFEDSASAETIPGFPIGPVNDEVIKQDGVTVNSQPIATGIQPFDQPNHPVGPTESYPPEDDLPF